jgi:plasmid maintenance system antidote protein VapI
MAGKKRNPEIVRRILELRESGMTFAKIAEEMGLPVSVAHEIVKQASKKSPSTEAEKPTSPVTPQETETLDVPNSSTESFASNEPEPLVLVSTPPVVNPRRHGRGRPPIAESGEVKRATTVAILPSVYDAARKICYVQRRTISDIINGFLESFVAENLNDLKKY